MKLISTCIVQIDLGKGSVKATYTNKFLNEKAAKDEADAEENHSIKESSKEETSFD
jgi:hypothetical protein